MHLIVLIALTFSIFLNVKTAAIATMSSLAEIGQGQDATQLGLLLAGLVLTAVSMACFVFVWKRTGSFTRRLLLSTRVLLFGVLLGVLTPLVVALIATPEVKPTMEFMMFGASLAFIVLGVDRIRRAYRIRTF